MDSRVPLYIQLPELVVEPSLTAECPACFALVLASRLEEHQRAVHG